MSDAQLQHLTTALADRYRVLRQIGRGGMATVYLADDPKHRRQVAIKVLEPRMSVFVATSCLLCVASEQISLKVDITLNARAVRLRLDGGRPVDDDDD